MSTNENTSRPCEANGCGKDATREFSIMGYKVARYCDFHSLKFEVAYETERAKLRHEKMVKQQRKARVRFWAKVAITPLYPFIWAE